MGFVEKNIVLRNGNRDLIYVAVLANVTKLCKLHNAKMKS